MISVYHVVDHVITVDHVINVDHMITVDTMTTVDYVITVTNVANPNIKDVTNRTAMGYAIEKQLNYCALLLSKAQGGEIGEVGYVHKLCVLLESFHGASTLRTDQGHFSFTDNQQQEPAAAVITVCCVLTGHNNDIKCI